MYDISPQGMSQLETILKGHLSGLHRKSRQEGILRDSLYQPKISIITTSFNQGQFLEKTILSVLNQDWPNIEYLIIDGGSTDNSVEIIRRYERHLNWWVSEPDNGQSNAINKGIRYSTGKYVTWLGSDDLLFPGSLQKMATALETNPKAGIVYGGVAFIDSQDRIIKTHTYTDMTLKKLLYKRKSTIAQPSSLLRRKTLEDAGGINEQLAYCMDYDLWIRLMRISPGLNLGQIILSAYRLHPSSKTVASYTKMALEKIKVNRRYTHDIMNKVIYAHYWYILEGMIKSLVKKK